MAKVFNVSAACKPEQHYMVKLEQRLAAIKELVDNGAYFTINRARQYGKTTTLHALKNYLQEDYCVIFLDFQTFGAAEFADENSFAVSFAEGFLWELKQNCSSISEHLRTAIDNLEKNSQLPDKFRLRSLFFNLRDICASISKPIVLIIDEVDSATNNQVFMDFLAQLRAYYISRDTQPTFQSVILAGVHDIKNMRRKMRSEEEHKVNSPWNIAADFNIDMSFSENEIAEMLKEYARDYQLNMDVNKIAQLLRDYTAGYPYLVSRLCKLMDEIICGKPGFETKEKVWTTAGILEAVKMILSEKNTLFESLIGKLTNYPELNSLIETLLFTGKPIAYNADNVMIDTATMLGFIKNQQGNVAIANRLFETRLYNFYLSTAQMQQKNIYTAALQDKNQFILDGYLNVRLILEKFVIHFNDLYGDSDKTFIEEEARKYFLLYLRPIINGTGNYYIESRTRELKRTDVIIDYHGEQYVIEMKIWHGNEYNSRGEKQLIEYLEDYHLNKGYMISFNFNKNKQTGVHEVIIGDKVLIEAVI